MDFSWLAPVEDPGPPREPDFTWPPPNEDLEACAIVRLDGAAAGRITPLVLTTPDIEPPPLPVAPPPLPVEVAAVPVPAPVSVAAPPARDWEYFGRTAFWRVERSDALARFMLEHSNGRDEDPETAGATRSAWLALFVTAACLFVTYTEFRADRLRGSPGGLQSAFAAETDPVPDPDAVPGLPKASSAPPLRPRKVDPEVEPEVVRRPEPLRRAPDTVTVRVGPTPARVTPPPTRVTAPPPAVSLPVMAARVEAPRPEPARAEPARVVALAPRPDAVPAVVTTRPEPRPEPALLRPEPIASRVEVVTAAAAEENDIRTTLTRWRTAYSTLNASAAQEVWPSVDVRALRSAFRGLKSQQYHFDRCQLTVTGARARAACTGRAVYVPGVGDQSPRTSTREWNFELKKADERWTIASARSS